MNFNELEKILQTSRHSIFEAAQTSGGIGDVLDPPAAAPDAGSGRKQQGPKRTFTPEPIAKILNKILWTEPYVARMFSATYTDWFEDASCKTAGVSVKNGRIQFYYNPAFVDECNGNGTLYFLIKHELYHILRMHKDRAMWKQAWGGRDHKLFNIAADSLINRDLVSDRSYAAIPQIAPAGGWFLYDKDADMEKYGSVEKATKKKYTGAQITESVFKFLKKHRDSLSEEDKNGDPGEGGEGGEGGDGGDSGPPKPMAVGSPIFDTKSKKFGKITKVWKNGTYSWEEITKQEAEALAKAGK
jgi:hypothetical protein